ncbi:Purine ribonucleoside efflux pump NepI [Klebsiella oxytoca]|uniref:MFS transporter n=1 Tax=Klebsiella grimontii TaxID=2058152 RepID=UPI00066806A2|nr:MFS transporter [Klebsiella grimontii]QLT64891.1 MFS transporter [Klebsiella oxytoca]MCS0530888.1 MFS transporter [Klebsiella grimontii]MCW9527107.1 MFS transporter [Klebsiella grimontii]MDH0810596.1 MFS transporter [Klebsiella grimontii]MDH2040335.1 MFS transporter [Klebsiella grimontii]
MPGYLVRATLIIAFVQFINALEYMIFNPLFTWMAPTFQVPVSQAGYVTGIYTLASVISGIGVWRWVGQLKPRRFLLCNMALLGGLTVMTLTTTRFDVLLFWRFLAGVVGGTTMGVASSLLVNIMPPQLRPRALASTIAAFSLVSIVGMPTMLFLSEKIGWQSAPATIGGLCIIALPLIVLTLPEQSIEASPQAGLRWSSSLLFHASGNALAQFSPMLIIPLLVPLLTTKLGASGDELPWFFFAGGAAGLCATKLTGRLCQRYSGYRISLLGSLLFILSLSIAFIFNHGGALFMLLFLAAAYCRLVASSAVAMRFPADSARAGFTLLQNTLMSLSTAAAFLLSSWLLSVDGGGERAMQGILLLCALSALPLPWLLRVQEKRLATRAAG